MEPYQLLTITAAILYAPALAQGASIEDSDLDEYIELANRILQKATAKQPGPT
jgi:hypothetical protein